MSIRIVDGVSSSKTYIVLAVNGGKRLAMRFIGLRQTPVILRNKTVDPSKQVMNVLMKLHVEDDNKDGSRGPITAEDMKLFGLTMDDLPRQHGNRHTFLVLLPIGYCPMTPTKFKDAITDYDIIGGFYDDMMERCKEAGAEQDANKREFFKKWWKEGAEELAKYSMGYGITEDAKNIRGLVVSEAKFI